MSTLAIPPPIYLSPQPRRQRWGGKKKQQKKNKNKKKPSRKSSHQQVKQIQAAVFSARSGRSSPPFSLSLSLSLSLFLSPSVRRLQSFCFTRMRFFPLSRCSYSSIKLLFLSSPLLSSTARPPSPPPPRRRRAPTVEREERENHTQRERERERERKGERKREEWSYLHPEIPLLPRSGGTNQCVMVV